VTYAEASAFLYSLERRGVRLGLDRIVGALREHGDPQEEFPSVLVAGTNGKGSVCAFVASMLQTAGLRTGLYTSPHLIDFRERIRIDGRMIPPETVAALTDAIGGSVARWELSFFEATTLIAFLWFRERGVDAAAVEVGLGGRLDATRPVRAAGTVITTISLDHTKILGGTRSEIAAEKGAILREGVPAALGVSSAEAMAVLRRRAVEVGAPVSERRRALRVREIVAAGEGTRFLLSPRGGWPLPEAELSATIFLEGRHQVANASLAVLAALLLPPRLRPDARAIQDGLSRARWPGRLQRLGSRPPIYCDVAHNAEGARSLARGIAQRGLKDLTLVIGMVEGKDARSVLASLAPHAREAHFCTPRTDRALRGEDLALAGAESGLNGTTHETPSDAIDAALRSAGERGGSGGVLVTGSFYTVGEAMAHLGYTPPDPLWADDRGGA